MTLTYYMSHYNFIVYLTLLWFSRTCLVFYCWQRYSNIMLSVDNIINPWIIGRTIYLWQKPPPWNAANADIRMDRQDDMILDQVKMILVHCHPLLIKYNNNKKKMIGWNDCTYWFDYQNEQIVAGIKFVGTWSNMLLNR